jgi:hypothetical protein
VAAVIGWTILRGAYEVVIDADEVCWRGLLTTGQAPLRDLRRVKGEWTPGRPVEFVFTRLSGFSIMPAQGFAEFVDRLHVVAPHVEVRLPASVWWFADWRRGVFEETN